MSAETPLSEPAEPPKAEKVPYSKENINTNAKKSQIDQIRQEGGYDKKTPEGKLALSAKWIQRAGLSPVQVDKVWKSIGVTDPKNKDEVTQKVAEWQEKNKLVGKDGKGDGILGWATLEALDTVIENEDKEYDKTNKNEKGNDEGYGLARVGYHERKNTEKSETKKVDEKSDEYKLNLEDQRLAIMEARNDPNSLMASMAAIEVTDLNGKVFTVDEEGKLIEKKEDPKRVIKEESATNESKIASSKKEVKIGDLVIEEGKWSKRIIKNMGAVGRGANKTAEQQLIKYGDKIVAFSNGKYSIATIDQKGNVGVFGSKEYKDLPLEFQQKNNQNIAKQVVEKYGSMKDWEMFAPSVEISGLKLGDLGRGTEEDGSITPEAAERVQFLKERLAPTIAKNPKMQEMTLGEYAQFSENPALIASSRFMKEVKTNSIGRVTSTKTKTGFVNPNEYGIPSDFEYAATGTGTTIKRPKTNSSLDTIMIAGKDGKYESQKDWLQKVKVDPDKEYVVYGMEDMRFKKSDNGDIVIYKKGNEKTPESKYMAGEKKWNEIKKAA